MVDLETSALIVIDMQNDFLARGGYYDVKHSKLNAKNGALEPADLDELATLYSRPPAVCEIRAGYEGLVARVHGIASGALAAGMCTVFVCAAYDRQATVRPPLLVMDPTRRDHACHRGTWGADLVDPLRPLAKRAPAVVTFKPSFDAFFATDLARQLRSKGIRCVYLCGVETNVCVLFSALSALSNGFRTIILEDAVATSVPDLHQPSLHILEVAKAGRLPNGAFLASLGRHGG